MIRHIRMRDANGWCPQMPNVDLVKETIDSMSGQPDPMMQHYGLQFSAKLMMAHWK